MVERSRIWRGPWRAPGRLVVPPSHGTPTMPISTSAGFRNSGMRIKVATSPKRGTTVPETGCGNSGLEGFEASFIFHHTQSCRPYRYSLRLQKSLSGRHELLDRRHKAVTFRIADHDVERHEATPGDPDAGVHHVEEEQLLGVLVAAGDVGGGPDRPRRGVRRHHRADAGELERHLLPGADRVQPLADLLAALVQLLGRHGCVDLAVARRAGCHGER